MNRFEYVEAIDLEEVVYHTENVSAFDVYDVFYIVHLFDLSMLIYFHVVSNETDETYLFDLFFNMFFFSFFFY